MAAEQNGPPCQPETTALKTTVLFALVVAFLANPPLLKGPGEEEKAAPKEAEQQAVPGDTAKAPKPGESSGSDALAKSDRKRRETGRKD